MFVYVIVNKGQKRTPEQAAARRVACSGYKKQHPTSIAVKSFE